VVPKGTLLGALCAAALLAGALEAAPVTVAYGPFDVTFYNSGDSNGVYAGEQDWTAEQMSDFAAAIAAWDDRIDNVPGRQIKLDALWIEFDYLSSYVLGGSYSPTNGDGATGWNYGEHVWRDGVDYTGPWTGFDTVIRYDITAGTASWNFGPDDPAWDEIDFRSVVTHELGHSLGFSATYDTDYDDWGNGWGTASSPFGWAGYTGLSAWDRNLEDSHGNVPEVGGDGTPGNFNQRDNPVFWNGASAVDYYGTLVEIYAPVHFAGGSSLSHLDESTHPDALMSPFVSTGPAPRAPTELEWRMMADMGWDVSSESIPIPAPGVAWLLASGLAGVALLRKEFTRCSG